MTRSFAEVKLSKLPRLPSTFVRHSLKGTVHIIFLLLTASFSSTSSADTASDPEFSFPGKTKGGEIGLNGSGTPVTFSHHYSEKAPTVGKMLLTRATKRITHLAFLRYFEITALNIEYASIFLHDSRNYSLSIYFPVSGIRSEVHVLVEKRASNYFFVMSTDLH